MTETIKKAKGAKPPPEPLPGRASLDPEYIPYTFTMSRSLLKRAQTYATVRNIPLETALNAALELGLTRLEHGLGTGRN
jgi:hypothetical protein